MVLFHRNCLNTMQKERNLGSVTSLGRDGYRKAFKDHGGTLGQHFQDETWELGLYFGLWPN